MTEARFQEIVTVQAVSLGWRAYHDYDSRSIARGAAHWTARGFPDLVLVHRTRGLLFAELKTERGRVSLDQRIWIDLLGQAGQRVYLWRPRDWFGGTIDRILMGEAT